MIKSNNSNIRINSQEIKKHTKAAEQYVDVTYRFDNGNFPYREWSPWIPIEYRRTGISIEGDQAISAYIEKIYAQLSSQSYDKWLSSEEQFWNTEKKRAKITREFFESLADLKWHCSECSLPANPNWARRIQDLKDFGYTIATDTKRFCPKCGKNTTHLILIPLPRNAQGNGYETWSPKLRRRIIKVLKHYDAYEGKTSNANLLPDHKFSEIRWNKDTKAVNDDNMSDDEIKAKFQLLTNLRNEQKREACRKCFLSGKRQCPFGIKYFYEGNEEWDPKIPQRGKEAEQGCIGCGWYDIEKWRQELNKQLEEDRNKQ